MTKGGSPSKKNPVKQFFRTIKSNLSDVSGHGRLKAIIGLVLLGITLFVSVSIVSFFFVGDKDQSVINNASVSEIILMKAPVSNWGKVYGAYLAQKIVDEFLGIGSLFLVFYLGTIAIKSIGVIRRINLVKRFVFFSVSALWASLTFSTVASVIAYEFPFRLGGLYGDEWVRVLSGSIGLVGLCIIIVCSAWIIATVVHKEAVDTMRSFLSLSWMKAPGKMIREKRTKDKETTLKKTEKLVKETSVSEQNIEDLPDDKDMGNLEVGGDSVLGTTEQKTEVSNSILAQDNISENKPSHETIGLLPMEEGNIEVVLAKGDQGSQPVSMDIDRNGSVRFNRDYPDAYVFPSIDLLESRDEQQQEIDMGEINEVKNLIIEALHSFKINVTPVRVTVGPTVTLYEVAPEAGIKISRIRSLEDDIALSIKSNGGIRIIAPIPGKGTIGIEVPNRTPRVVSMKSLLTSRKFQENKMELPIAMGRTITDDVFMFDLAKMPHLLIAGATGQGKSVGLNVMITSLLYSKLPSELKFLLIDPKMLEFSIYEGIDKQYLARLEGEDKCIVTDMNKVVPTLNSVCLEMDNRYRLLTEAKVRNVKEYNALIKENKLKVQDGHRYLPYIVLIVDEFADLIMTSGKDVERPIARIAQKARAAGIHMIIATQRPSTDVITGIIKANFPARIAFKVFSQVDSRTILDGVGANLLVGKGDMLFYQGREMQRLQCALVDTPETEEIVTHIHTQESPLEPYELPEYVEDVAGKGKELLTGEGVDPLFREVALMVVSSQQGSTSNIQRRFNIGYNRAGRIMDQLEAVGIVSPQDSSKPRQVLIQDEMTLERLLESIG